MVFGSRPVKCSFTSPIPQCFDHETAEVLLPRNPRPLPAACLKERRSGSKYMGEGTVES